MREKEYAKVVDDLHSYFKLSPSEQKASNEEYKNNVHRSEQRKHKATFQKLNTRRLKLRAIKDHPRGVCIAERVRFDIEGIDGVQDMSDDEEDEEEINPGPYWYFICS